MTSDPQVFWRPGNRRAKSDGRNAPYKDIAMAYIEIAEMVGVAIARPYIDGSWAAGRMLETKIAISRANIQGALKASRGNPKSGNGTPAITWPNKSLTSLRQYT